MGLLIIFSAYLLVAIGHQGTAPCNCFGTLHPSSVWVSIARNICLMILALIGIFGSWYEARGTKNLVNLGNA